MGTTAPEGLSRLDKIVKVFAEIDRRIIYLFVATSLAIPLITKYTLAPAPMKTASAFYDTLEQLEPKPGQLVLIAADWGPGTQAENLPQTAVAIEHLMRKRIPFGLISLTPQATPFLEALPLDAVKKLEAESPGDTWTYGNDWVNFGFQPGGRVMIQRLARATDWTDSLKTDAKGVPLEDIACMNGVDNIANIPLLLEFTGSVGAFNQWVQFFFSDAHRPDFLHGCTSITIPEAYTYFASRQIIGLQEGLAGAATYESLLSKAYPRRVPSKVLIINTSLAISQLLVIGLIILGNIGFLWSKHQGGHRKQ